MCELSKEETEVTNELDFLKNKYRVETMIGYGSFSSVYKAVNIENNTDVALKVITKTTSPSRILDELKVLKKLNGANFCIPLLDVLRNNDQVVAVFPLIDGVKFKKFIEVATIEDIKTYMHCLLTAVDHIHKQGYIHRDIKPSNFLYDMNLKIGFIIDFGLTQTIKAMPIAPKAKEPFVLFFNSIVKQSKPPGYYDKDTRPKMKAHRAGTRGFRAPEVLFKYQYQTQKIDIWSVGVILLCILTTQYPFFLSNDDIDALVELGTIFGHAQMRKTAKLFSRVWKSNINTITEDGIGLENLIVKLNNSFIFNEDVIDLLKKLLELDPNKRISAEEALNHDFFKE
ncbi:CDC71 [Hepatospora eriocheir]|uniref:non-specific serine/threonine protein kinase n=1 Tax=Hepatospora eriocheir TaxID=1081669 RepID=A0A1X0QKB4_9MICR|nr:CDC71 [Hepatospora eriocheir]